VLVNAAASFSATIQQQLEMFRSDSSPAELAEKTIDHAEAREAYFKALRAKVPELMNIAMGKERRANQQVSVPLNWKLDSLENQFTKPANGGYMNGKGLSVTTLTKTSQLYLPERIVDMESNGFVTYWLTPLLD
jgi:hypothetical protein